MIAVTLEHGYDIGGFWLPKVRAGIYNCVRHAPNRLPYETFMLENVPDFQGAPVSGILIHKANWERELEGCIAVGLAAINNNEMITGSKLAFDKMMSLQAAVNSFKLTIAEDESGAAPTS